MSSSINDYFNILTDDYPKFLDKYEQTAEMQLLKERMQLCGCDYTKIWNIRYPFTVFDHSKACALQTWNFTKNKAATLSSFFHDLGTPAFNHCVDFYLNDHINQESSEKSVKEILLQSKEILEYLKEDGIDIFDITNLSKYTLVENKSPKLIVDRLDGIMHTNHIWLNMVSLSDLKNIYDRVIVLINKDKELEFGFSNKEYAEYFFELIYNYSMVLQSNEDIFTMQFVADAIKFLIDKKYITLEDLYIRPEIYLVKLLEKVYPKWKNFNESTKLSRCNYKVHSSYYKRIDVKKRIVDPIYVDGSNVYRISETSDHVKKLLKNYHNFKDSKYYDMNK